MNVYDQAHGLAQAIKGSEEFKQFDEARQQLKGNEELSRMVQDFQTNQFELQANQMSGQQLGPEDMSSVQQLYAILLKDPLAARYMETEMRFSIMMKDVYEIIGEATGLGDMFG